MPVGERLVSKRVSSSVILRTSAIGTQEAKKRASQKAALGYDSTIYTLDQVKQVLTRISSLGQHQDPLLYVHLLQVCGAEKSLTLGRQVHEQLRKSGVETGAFTDNNLISMYGRCGSVADAYSVFQEIADRTVVSWTSMITAFAQNGHYKDGLKIYESMLVKGEKPNKVTFFTVVDACTRGGMLTKAKSVAENIGETEFHQDSALGTALLNMFGKCGDLTSARAIFEAIDDKTVITWTSLITTYVNHGFYEEAFDYFNKMQIKLVTPNEVTFVAVLNACTGCKDLDHGRTLHAQAITCGLSSRPLVGTALVNMYNKSGCVSEAWKAFNMILEPDVVAYNAILHAYSELETSTPAFVIFRRMLLEGHAPTKATFVSLLNACSWSGALGLHQGRLIHRFVASEMDTIVRTALLNMYGKCEAVEDAKVIFSEMSSRNLISWNTMLGVYSDQGSPDEAMSIYRSMQQEGVKADAITFLPLLNSFATPEALKDGRQVHAHLTELGLENELPVVNAVLDMYGKCGSLKEARTLFDGMNSRNVISWTSIITVYFQQGKDKESVEFYHRMLLEAAIPDRLTFATVLNACANLPSYKDGKAVHDSVRESGATVELSLGTALVNLYGKCGHLAQAQDVFDKMVERDLACWNSIMSAYAQHGHAREAVYTFRLMQQDDVRPDGISFVTVLSACRHAGLLDDGLDCFASMTQLYGLAPTAEHHSNLIDLLGRTGHLDEAERYVRRLKPPCAFAWTSFMDACRVHGDVERATLVAESCLELDPDDHPTYITLSNIYSEGEK